jgi:cobalt/nickel transport system permease protein
MESHLDYHAHNNGLREVNTHSKILFAVSTLLICVASPSPIIPIFVFCLITFLLIFQAKIPIKTYFKFISIPFSFAFITLIYMSLFYGTSDPIWYIASLGSFDIVIYRDGIQLGFLVFSRIIGAFSCLVFLTFTTPMTELFSVFHKIRIPTILIEISMLMYRFIFLFLSEAETMYHAQKTRLGYSNYKNSFQCLGMLAGNLFIRTWFQGEKINMAMESRGYQGHINTLKQDEGIKIRYLALIITFECFIIFITYITRDFQFL